MYFNILYYIKNNVNRFNNKLKICLKSSSNCCEIVQKLPLFFTLIHLNIFCYIPTLSLYNIKEGHKFPNIYHIVKELLKLCNFVEII